MSNSIPLINAIEFTRARFKSKVTYLGKGKQERAVRQLPMTVEKRKICLWDEGLEDWANSQ